MKKLSSIRYEMRSNGSRGQTWGADIYNLPHCLTGSYNAPFDPDQETQVDI